MEVRTFIENFRKAFGEVPELPIVFWYSDIAVNPIEKINGCMFKGMKSVRDGVGISLDEQTIGCGGGKYYAGFIDLPERIPSFVSLKEKYKKTPELVSAGLEELGLQRATKRYLNFMRIDSIDTFDAIEGVLFFATPDVLSGLATWAFFDNNDESAVSSIFSSGCSAVISRVVMENRQDGRRTFLGFFDPSVRPHVEPDKLSFVIPMSRFKEMYHTITECCLFDTHAWGKVRKRINGEE